MRHFILLAFLLLASPLTLQAQHQLVRQVYDTPTNTWVEVTSLFGKLPAYGYAPIRVTINNGTQEKQNFVLKFTSKDDHSYGQDSGSRMNSSFSCSCDPSSKETYDFLVPLTSIFQTSSYNSGTGLDLTLSCSGYASTSGHMFTETSDTWPTILLSNTLYVPNASSLTSHINSSHSRSGSDLQFAGEFSTKTMPTDWRAYLGQDVIMLTSDNWTDLDPGARTAILEWNRFGGRLIIYSSNEATTFSSLNITESATHSTTHSTTESASIQRSLGQVSLLPLPSSKRLDATKTTKMIETIDGSAYETNYQSILNDYSGRWPLQITLGEKNFNIAFFILILVTFGVLVGPINLFVFAKAGKRHKLFITTPIISLAASLLLIVIIIFQDGFGGRGHRLLLMEITPEENNAYIIQEQATRTGVLLSSSFETSEPTLMTPVALKKSRWSRIVLNGQSPSRYTANHGDQGLDVSGDWFQSRSVHGHLLKTIRPTRGRIELSPVSGAPKLTSSFDFDLGTLFYQSPDQSWWKADALNKGNTTTLNPCTENEFKEWLKIQSDRFSKRNAQQFKSLITSPGRFYAITEDAPGIDTYNSIKWLTTTTIITGTVDN